MNFESENTFLKIKLTSIIIAFYINEINKNLNLLDTNKIRKYKKILLNLKNRKYLSNMFIQDYQLYHELIQ